MRQGLLLLVIWACCYAVSLGYDMRVGYEGGMSLYNSVAGSYGSHPVSDGGYDPSYVRYVYPYDGRYGASRYDSYIHSRPHFSRYGAYRQDQFFDGYGSHDDHYGAGYSRYNGARTLYNRRPVYSRYNLLWHLPFYGRYSSYGNNYGHANNVFPSLP